MQAKYKANSCYFVFLPHKPKPNLCKLLCEFSEWKHFFIRRTCGVKISRWHCHLVAFKTYICHPTQRGIAWKSNETANSTISQQLAWKMQNWCFTYIQFEFSHATIFTWASFMGFFLGFFLISYQNVFQFLALQFVK